MGLLSLADAGVVLTPLSMIIPAWKRREGGRDSVSQILMREIYKHANLHMYTHVLSMHLLYTSKRIWNIAWHKQIVPSFCFNAPEGLNVYQLSIITSYVRAKRWGAFGPGSKCGLSRLSVSPWDYSPGQAPYKTYCVPFLRRLNNCFSIYSFPVHPKGQTTQRIKWRIFSRHV